MFILVKCCFPIFNTFHKKCLAAMALSEGAEKFIKNWYEMTE